MTDIDTNVGNYTLSELLTITGIENEEVTEDEIMRKTDKLINQFKQKNPQLSVFLKELGVSFYNTQLDWSINPTMI